MALIAGSEAWWKAKTGPEWCLESDGNYQVTFWWRDPAGTETTSSTTHVWIYITGVTDHHQQATPQSLARIPGTDVWCWQTQLEAGWRGSYCLIPSDGADDFSPQVFAQLPPDRMALREGWRKLLPRAIADPLNPHSWRGGRGHPVSPLAMPGAPHQPGWDRPDAVYTPATVMSWHSQRLNNHRRVWVYTTGDDPSAERPLAILLDGQFWAESMPVWPALAALTEQGLLPPAVYLLIDVIDTTHRSQELPFNPDFWLAIQQELLPQVQAVTPFSDDAGRTVVAGQSLAVCQRSMPPCTGRSVLAACSVSRAPFGGQRATASRMACLSNNSSAANCQLTGCVLCWKPGYASRLFSGLIGPFIPNYNTHSRRFSGVRLTADMMRFAGAAG